MEIIGEILREVLKNGQQKFSSELFPSHIFSIKYFLHVRFVCRFNFSTAIALYIQLGTEGSDPSL